jgi:predicted nucleotidyltransferase
MVIYRVFDEVFRTWSNVAVMRALVDTSTGFTGNEVARTAGMHPNSALRALTLLEELGIVNRQIGGRDHIFSLNREHYLFQEVLAKVFQTEISFPQEIINTLASILKKQVYSAVIFGSTARREETALSDLDICCIVNAPIDRIQVNSLLDKKSKTLNKKFGIKLAPIFFLKEQFIRKRKSKLIKSIANEGILITGKDPKGLLDG